MVGGFSTALPAVQSHSPQTRSSTLLISTRTVIIVMLALHAILIHGAASAASPAVSMGSRRSNSQPNKTLQNLSTKLTTIARNRRLMLARRADAIRAWAGADQAMRALVGSSPPKCIKKCGACTPCKSVLVPIHTTNFPATPAEYYPEAWRCQCKGKLYNP
ncbi:hypothetical protein L7F22_058488 [Adiantum nelumboides]|nr:hypothetical protein [Adiantum nelumboides]